MPLLQGDQSLYFMVPPDEGSIKRYGEEILSDYIDDDLLAKYGNFLELPLKTSRNLTLESAFEIVLISLDAQLLLLMLD